MAYDFTSTNPEATLRILQPDLRELILSTTDEGRLRVFACRCAALALTKTGLKDTQSHSAVETGLRYAHGQATIQELKDAFDRASKAALHREETSWELEAARIKAADAEGDVEQVARASTSASCCVMAFTLEAASSAAYEASFCADNGEEMILQLAQELLADAQSGAAEKK